MADELGGKKTALGGPKTTDRRRHGVGDNIRKIKTHSHKTRLKQLFITGGLSARTAMPRTAAPPKTDFKTGG